MIPALSKHRHVEVLRRFVLQRVGEKDNTARLISQRQLDLVTFAKSQLNALQCWRFNTPLLEEQCSQPWRLALDCTSDLTTFSISSTRFVSSRVRASTASLITGARPAAIAPRPHAHRLIKLRFREGRPFGHDPKPIMPCPPRPIQRPAVSRRNHPAAARPRNN